MGKLLDEYEEILRGLKEKGADDELIQQFRKFSTTTLFRRADDAETTKASNAKMTERITKFENGAKVEKALREAGVDFADLRPAEKRAIADLTFEGNEPSEDWAASTVSNLGLPMRRAGA